MGLEDMCHVVEGRRETRDISIGVLGKWVTYWESWGNSSYLTGGLGEMRHDCLGVLGKRVTCSALMMSSLDCLSRTAGPIGSSGVFRWPRRGVVLINSSASATLSQWLLRDIASLHINLSLKTVQLSPPMFGQFCE